MPNSVHSDRKARGWRMVPSREVAERALTAMTLGGVSVSGLSGGPTRMPELAREAIATKPDVVVAVSTVAILAVKEASSTVPIVMSFIGEDPIEKGVANSFARPGGCVTGVAMLAAKMDGTRAALLHDIVPASRLSPRLTHATPNSAAPRIAKAAGTATIPVRNAPLLRRCSIIKGVLRNKG